MQRSRTSKGVSGSNHLKRRVRNMEYDQPDSRFALQIGRALNEIRSQRPGSSIYYVYNIVQS